VGAQHASACGQGRDAPGRGHAHDLAHPPAMAVWPITIDSAKSGMLLLQGCGACSQPQGIQAHRLCAPVQNTTCLLHHRGCEQTPVAPVYTHTRVRACALSHAMHKRAHIRTSCRTPAGPAGPSAPRSPSAAAPARAPAGACARGHMQSRAPPLSVQLHDLRGVAHHKIMRTQSCAPPLSVQLHDLRGVAHHKIMRTQSRAPPLSVQLHDLRGVAQHKITQAALSRRALAGAGAHKALGI